MREENRKVSPAFIALGAAIWGCLAGWRESGWGGVFVALLGGVGLLTRRAKDVSLFLLMGGAAWLRWESAVYTPLRKLPDETPVVVEGVVLESVQRSANNLTLTVRGWVLPRNGLQKAYGTVQIGVSLPSKTEFPSVGSRLRAYGRLAQPSGARNPGGFDEQLFLASRGVDARILVRSPKRIEVLEEGFSLRSVFVAFRKRLLAPAEKTLPSPYDALFAGVLLGEKRDIPDPVLDAFVRSGVVHVLVVSGANFALVTALAYSLFQAMRVPLRVRYVATMGFAFFFAGVVGFSAPVVRALVLTELYLLARLLERDTMPAHLVALSALGILLVHPPALFDVGFQLSFGAIGALVFFLPRWNATLAPLREKLVRGRLGRFLWKGIVQTFLATFAVEWVLTPLLAWHFGRLTWVGFLANLPVVFLGSGILIASAVAALGGLFSVSVGAFLSHSALGGFALLLPIVRGFSALPGASLPVPRPTAPELILYGLGVGGLFVPEIQRFLRERTARRVLFGTACLGSLVWCGIERLRSPLLEVTFLDVGQGEAIFLRLPSGERLLLDAGSHPAEDAFDNGERVVAPFLTANGHRSLDIVVETHADNDHAGGLPYLLRTFPVKTLVGLPPKPLGTTTDRAIRAVAPLGARLGAGETLVETTSRGKPLRVSVLYPASDDTPTYDNENSNNDSLVLQVIYGEVRLLFTGDIEREVETLLVERHRRGKIDLRADVLKVPHHGSQTSSSPEFLDAVQPRVAVISAGRRNRYGHPSSEVITRYETQKIPLYRTDRNGAIRLWTDGHRVWVRATVP